MAAPAAATPAAALPPGCPAHATTHITVVGNFDASAASPTLDFDAHDPKNTTNFSTTATVFDAWGRSGILDLYFRKAEDNTVDYYALFGAGYVNGLVIGSGRLMFSPFSGALLSNSIAMRARLPGPAGFDAPEISIDFGVATAEGGTGLDGMTSNAGPSNLLRFQQNGIGASFGPDCPALSADVGPTGPEAFRTRPVFGIPACVTGQTTSFYVQVNLPLSLPVGAARWNYATPLTLPLTDARGRTAPLLMYFRHPSAASWSYEVELAEQNSEPIGSGTLTFNDNGSLRRVDVQKAIHYALPEAGSALDIALDFGSGTDRGDAGVDGSTAFPSAPEIGNLSVRGAGPGLGAPCSESTALYDTGAWANGGYAPGRSPFQTTRSVRTDSINLSSYAPLRHDAWDPQAPAATSSAAFTGTVFDASGNSWRFTFYARHIASADWEYAYIADSPLGQLVSDTATLRFAENGALQRSSRVSDFRLPLSDGSPGPAIELQSGTSIEQGGSGLDWIVSFSGPSQGTLQASSRRDDAR